MYGLKIQTRNSQTIKQMTEVFHHPSYAILRRTKQRDLTTSHHQHFSFAHLTRTTSSCQKQKHENIVNIIRTISLKEMGVAQDIVDCALKNFTSLMVALVPVDIVPEAEPKRRQRSEEKEQEEDEKLGMNSSSSSSYSSASCVKLKISSKKASSKLFAVAGFVVAEFDSTRHSCVKIHLFFTFPYFRGQQLATRMIDCLLNGRICYGCVIPRNRVSFGEPSEDGMKFAVKFLGVDDAEDVPVFRYD